MSVFDHAGRRDGEVLTEDYRFEPHPQLRGAYTRPSSSPSGWSPTRSRKRICRR